MCVCVYASMRAYMRMMCGCRNACQATHMEVREQPKNHFSPTSRCAPGITQAMRLMRQPPSLPEHLTCLLLPMLYFDGLSLLCCLSYLNNCPISFISSAWKLMRHKRSFGPDCLSSDFSSSKHSEHPLSLYFQVQQAGFPPSLLHHYNKNSEQQALCGLV